MCIEEKNRFDVGNNLLLDFGYESVNVNVWPTNPNMLKKYYEGYFL